MIPENVYGCLVSHKRFLLLPRQEQAERLRHARDGKRTGSVRIPAASESDSSVDGTAIAHRS